MKSSRAQTTEALCHKVKHLLPEDNLQLYQDKFMNKHFGPKYYVNVSSKTKLRTKFFLPFDRANLLNFIGLKKKYNPNYVKAFYYNLVVFPAGLESRFKDKIVKFTYSIFIKYLDMVSDGADIFVRFPEYDRVSYVLPISKSVFENLDISKIGISQGKFDIRFLHWIIVKILYRKPENWGRANDHNLYLM